MLPEFFGTHQRRDGDGCGRTFDLEHRDASFDSDEMGLSTVV